MEYKSRVLGYMAIGLIALGTYMIEDTVYAQQTQPAKSDKNRSLPIYTRGKVFLPPAMRPNNYAVVRRDGSGNVQTSSTDAKKGTTTTTRPIQNAKQSAAEAKRKLDELNQRLKSKGYIRK